MGETTDQVRSVDPLDRSTAETMSNEMRSPARSDSDALEDAARIRSDIEQTRAEMGDTIEALQQKLDPAVIKEQVKEKVREKASEAYDSAKQTVKDNAIAKAGQVAASVSDTVAHVKERAGDGLHRAGDTLKHQGSTALDFVRANPVAFTVIGGGLGLLALLSRGGQSEKPDAGVAYAREEEGGHGIAMAITAVALGAIVGSGIPAGFLRACRRS